MWLVNGEFEPTDIAVRYSKLLRAGKTYHIGRKHADITVPHQPISRQAGTITVGGPSEAHVGDATFRPALIFRTEKKEVTIRKQGESDDLEGTLVNLGDSVELEDGDRIWLTMERVLTVSWLPIAFGFSKAKQAEVNAHAKGASELGISVSRAKRWDASYTHLVTPSLRITQTVLLAAISCAPIVRQEFVDLVFRLGSLTPGEEADGYPAFESRFELPDPAPFFPELDAAVDGLGKETLAKLLKPSARRRQLFRGMTFVLVHDGDEASMAPHADIVRAAGGVVMHLDTASTDTNNASVTDSLLGQFKRSSAAHISSNPNSDAPQGGLVIVTSPWLNEQPWYTRLLQWTQRETVPLTDPQAIANAVLHVDCRSHFQEPPQQAPVEAATPEVEMQPPAQAGAPAAAVPEAPPVAPPEATPEPAPVTEEAQPAPAPSGRKPLKRRAGTARTNILDDVFGGATEMRSQDLEVSQEASPAPPAVGTSSATAVDKQRDAESMPPPRAGGRLKRRAGTARTSNIFDSLLSDEPAGASSSAAGAGEKEDGIERVSKKYRMALDAQDARESAAAEGESMPLSVDEESEPVSQAPQASARSASTRTRATRSQLSGVPENEDQEMSPVDVPAANGRMTRKRRAASQDPEMEPNDEAAQSTTGRKRRAMASTQVEEPSTQVQTSNAAPSRTTSHASNAPTLIRDAGSASSATQAGTKASKSSKAVNVAEPDTEPKFLQALASQKRGKKKMDEFDAEFNKLRIARPVFTQPTSTSAGGPVVDANEVDAADADFEAFRRMAEDQIDMSVRGNFVQVDFVPLVRKTRTTQNQAAERPEWRGVPNFKKFKVKEPRRPAMHLELQLTEPADYGVGEAYWQAGSTKKGTTASDERAELEGLDAPPPGGGRRRGTARTLAASDESDDDEIDKPEGSASRSARARNASSARRGRAVPSAAVSDDQANLSLPEEDDSEEELDAFSFAAPQRGGSSKSRAASSSTSVRGRGRDRGGTAARGGTPTASGRPTRATQAKEPMGTASSTIRSETLSDDDEDQHGDEGGRGQGRAATSRASSAAPRSTAIATARNKSSGKSAAAVMEISDDDDDSDEGDGGATFGGFGTKGTARTTRSVKTPAPAKRARR